MKKVCILLCLMMCLTVFSGCEEIAAQAETIVQQIDMKAVITAALEAIDPEELKAYARQGYDTLADRFPSLSGENIRAFLRENGLNLLKECVENKNPQMQENARKLGQILVILNPELSDEINSVIVE